MTDEETTAPVDLEARQAELAAELAAIKNQIAAQSNPTLIDLAEALHDVFCDDDHTDSDCHWQDEQAEYLNDSVALWNQPKHAKFLEKAKSVLAEPILIDVEAMHTVSAADVTRALKAARTTMLAS